MTDSNFERLKSNRSQQEANEAKRNKSIDKNRLCSTDDDFVSGSDIKQMSACNAFVTIMQSVISLQMKKSFSYKIGVATIFMVSAFVTVLFSSTALTTVIFF